MVYLDYSATTPVNKEVLDTFMKATTDYFGNPNSLHKLGLDAKKLIDASTKQIANILNVKETEVIYGGDTFIGSVIQGSFLYNSNIGNSKKEG